MPEGPSRESVRRTYDRIAEHFARTRASGWPEVETFLAGRHVDRAIDLGCGNGRHFDALHASANAVVGADFSRPLLRIAQNDAAPGIDLVQADAVTLPFRAGTFELGLFIATLHHVPGRGARIRALDEFARILRGDGLVSVWSVTADRFEFDESHEGYVSWTLPDGEIVERYYHLYDRTDFTAELAESRLEVRAIEGASGNWYAQVRGASTFNRPRDSA